MEYEFKKAEWVLDESQELSAQTIETLHREMEEKIKASIERLIESGENFLGEGKTAQVHFLENDKKLCYKIIRKTDVMVRPDSVDNLPSKYRQIYDRKKAAKEKLERDNSLLKNKEVGETWHVDLFAEAEYLDRARTVDPEGPVKIPRPDARIEIRGREEGEGYEATDDFEILLMETMDAVSVDDLMRKAALPPEGFDYDAFCQQVQDFVTLMHGSKLYHRDLHAGNVMIERVTGRPVIIDFGRSTLSTEEDAYIEEIRPGAKMHFIRDEQMFRDKVKIPLGQYLNYRKLTKS